MRRKIIKQGNNSYTLTLPINWIREEKLDQGGEVEINQEDNNLLIKIPNDLQLRESSINFDSKDYNERTLRNILNQSYRKGYDRITIKSPNKQQINDIRDITRHTLLGFELVDDQKDCIIQKIAEPSSENFHAVLRRMFFYIIDESKEILQNLKDGKIDMKKRQHAKNVVDNYTNLCKRLVVKDKIGGTKSSYILFLIVSRFSLIHHAYYYMCRAASEQKKFSISKETLSLLEETNKMFSLFHEAFYTKNIDKAHEIGVIKDKLLFKDLYQSLKKTSGTENIMLYHLGEIIRLTHLQSSNLFGLVDSTYPE